MTRLKSRPATRVSHWPQTRYADVLFRGGDLQRFFAGGRRDDHFDELARDDRLRGFCIQLAVKGDDAAERGGWVGFVCAIVGVENRVADGNAAWVSVLDDHAGWLIELFHALQRRIGIGNVVIGERFTLQLGSGCHGSFFDILFYIEGSLLVAVFAVAHILLLNEVQIQGARGSGQRLLCFRRDRPEPCCRSS